MQYDNVLYSKFHSPSQLSINELPNPKLGLRLLTLIWIGKVLPIKLGSIEKILMAHAVEMQSRYFVDIHLNPSTETQCFAHRPFISLQILHSDGLIHLIKIPEIILYTYL
jgi:hypothetical protein